MFVKNINFSGRVLDYGCGYGSESILLSPYCQEIIGLDINKNKIKVFKKITQEIKLLNVKPIIYDGNKIPLKNEYFDMVFCNESLSHVQDIEKSLAEIYRVLKKGGKIIVADTKRWNPYGLWMIYIKRDFEENYFNLWTMKRLLSSCGYRQVTRVKYITAPRDPFRKFAKHLWFILQYIDPKYVLTGVKE
jgi:ubiquinone/menaquinone biosynthesis C-methylase UbiE